MLLAATLTITISTSSPAGTTGDDGRTSRQRSAPRAVTPFTTFSFGDVYAGEVISQIFVIRNDGDADLQLKDFVSGCGCAATRWDRIIAPGKEGTATLEVQTVSQAGSILKVGTLHTNDPERPAIDFSVSANVLNGTSLRRGRHIGPVFVSPDARAGLYAVAGKTASFEFSITADNTPVKILRVEGGTKHFASRVEVIEPGRNYKIVVESLPIETADLYTDQLRVTTDSPFLSVFNIEVVLRIYGRQ